MKVNFFRIAALVCPAVTYLFGLGGCGTLAGNPGDKPKPQSASVTFALTDAAVENAKSVFITVDSLEVSLAGEGWITIPLAATTEIDLLQFQNGKSTPLAALQSLSVGTYTQTRLKLASEFPPRLIEIDGTEHELTIPSASQSGIKIVTPFTVELDKPLNLTIDFDLRKSIKLTGSKNGKGAANRKYMMKPVLRLLKDDNTGFVTGKATDGATVCIYKTDAAKDEDSGCDGSENASVVTDGAFHLAFIPEGTYELRIFYKDGSIRDIPGIRVQAGLPTAVDAMP